MLYQPITPFQKVSPPKISDVILEQLEEAIILKEFLSEEQLPAERELAEIFKVSRLAVREALAQLEQKGLIEKRLGGKGGTFVLPLTKNAHQRTREEIQKDWDQMKAVFEFRSYIEPESARLAAERIDQSELLLLQDLVEKNLEVGHNREMQRSLDVKFHFAVARASRNIYFEKAVRQIRTKINPALDLSPYNSNSKLAYEKHIDLLDALRSRNGDQAKAIMESHVSQTATAVQAIVFSEK